MSWLQIKKNNTNSNSVVIIIKNTLSTRNRILHIIPSWLTCCFSTTESTSEPAFRFLSVAWWKLYGAWGVGRLKEGRSWDFLKKLVNNLLPWSKRRIPHNQINWFSVNYKAFSTMKKLLKKFCEIFQKKISRFLLKESIKKNLRRTNLKTMKRKGDILMSGLLNPCFPQPYKANSLTLMIFPGYIT